jgi:hypothetical protein
MRTRTPLPTEASQRALALVEASRPNSSRPRLSDPELEARMSEREAEQAVRHAQREDLIDRLERVTELVDGSEDGAVAVEIDGETSAVHHAMDLVPVTSRIVLKGG